MRSSTIVKLILILFFIVFFGFLFHYFYDPGTKQDDKQTQKKTDSDLMPFGNFSNDSSDEEKDTKKPNKVDDKDSEVVKKEKEEQIPALRQISNVPTAGAIIEPINKKEILALNEKKGESKLLDLDGQYYEIRYIDARNNDMHRTFNFTLKQDRIVKATIPKLIKAIFFDKDHYLLRYNESDNLRTYAVTLTDKKSIESEIVDKDKVQKKDEMKNFNGVFLENDIQQIAISEATNKMFYTKKSSTGINGYIANFLGDGKKSVFHSPITEYNFNWSNPRYIFLGTKASYDADSLFFILDTKNNFSQRLFYKGVVAGVGLPNHNFTKFLISGKEHNIQQIWIVDQKKNAIDPNIGTLAEKCVWSKDNINVYCATPSYLSKTSPDDWYKGKEYSIDSIYKINTKTNENVLIFTAKEKNQMFDIINLKLDSTERFLYFKDKKTDFYWSLDLFEY